MTAQLCTEFHYRDEYRGYLHPKATAWELKQGWTVMIYLKVIITSYLHHKCAILVTKTKTQTKMIACYNTRIKRKMKGSGKTK